MSVPFFSATYTTINYKIMCNKLII